MMCVPSSPDPKPHSSSLRSRSSTPRRTVLLELEQQERPRLFHKPVSDKQLLEKGLFLACFGTVCKETVKKRYVTRTSALHLTS